MAGEMWPYVRIGTLLNACRAHPHPGFGDILTGEAGDVEEVSCEEERAVRGPDLQRVPQGDGACLRALLLSLLVQ